MRNLRPPHFAVFRCPWHLAYCTVDTVRVLLPLTPTCVRDRAYCPFVSLAKQIGTTSFTVGANQRWSSSGLISPTTAIPTTDKMRIHVSNSCALKVWLLGCLLVSATLCYILTASSPSDLAVRPTRHRRLSETQPERSLDENHQEVERPMGDPKPRFVIHMGPMKTGTSSL